MNTLRPLGKIMNALERAGYNSTYAYDDLIFIEHSPFLLRFDPTDTHTLHFFAHADGDDSERQEIFAAVSDALNEERVTAIDYGTFELNKNPDDDNKIDISFHEKK